MPKYLFIESRDPFDSADSAYFSELVLTTSNRGHDTTLFLIQNGVLVARRGSKQKRTPLKLIRGNVKILADEFSLRERAVKKLVRGIKAADISRLVTLLLEPGTRAIWH